MTMLRLGKVVQDEMDGLSVELSREAGSIVGQVAIHFRKRIDKNHT